MVASPVLVCSLCIFCHFSYVSRENELVKDNLLVQLVVKYPDEDTTILKREVTTSSNCML